MKKRNLFFITILFAFMALPVYADSLESVRVIKFWDDTDDMVVERSSGERLLIQHNRMCQTMSTEFPIKLLWSEGEITEAKIASNEICDVYNTGPFSSSVTIHSRIPGSNSLTTEHLAEIDWNGGRYEIDYDEGCRNLRYYVGETAYVYTPHTSLEGATLYLPKARGNCKILSSTLLEDIEEASPVSESPIKNLRHQAENNQAFFSWDDFPEDETWLVQVAHSKYQLDPNDYELTQMPKLKRTKANSIRILQLANNQPYYFYLTASNEKGELAPWIEVPLTPIQTAKRITNNVDPEPFEIEMTENDNAFRLVWPDKSEHNRRHLIMVYVDGKREVFKIIPGEQNYFDLEKKPEWSSSRFRMTVRTIPAKPSGMRYFDSIFWRKG